MEYFTRLRFTKSRLECTFQKSIKPNDAFTYPYIPILFCISYTIYFFVAIKSKVRNFFYENDYKPEGNFRMRINKIIISWHA